MVRCLVFIRTQSYIGVTMALAVVKKTDFPLISAIIGNPTVRRHETKLTCGTTLDAVKSSLNSIALEAYGSVGGGASLPPVIASWINEHSPLFIVAPRAQITEYRIEFSNGVGSAASFSISGLQDDEQKISLCCKCGNATVAVPTKTETVRDHYIGISGGGYPEFCPDTPAWTGLSFGDGVGPGWSQDMIKNRQNVYPTIYNNSHKRGNPWAWCGDRKYTRALNPTEMAQLTAYLVAHLK